jgi:hypothetical protein
MVTRLSFFASGHKVVNVAKKKWGIKNRTIIKSNNSYCKQEKKMKRLEKDKKTIKRKFLASVLGLIMVMYLVQTAGAAYISYSGAWETTDTQSSAYTISLLGNLSNGWSFGVYDIAAAGNPSSLTLIDSTNTISTFYVDGSNTLWVTQGISSGNTLSLTSSNGGFGFYFSDGSTDYFTCQYSAGPVNQWLLKMADSFAAGGPVITSDVNPVPIPGAFWLLGSGLFGLVAVRRGKKV